MYRTYLLNNQPINNLSVVCVSPRELQGHFMLRAARNLACQGNTLVIDCSLNV